MGVFILLGLFLVSKLLFFMVVFWIWAGILLRGVNFERKIGKNLKWHHKDIFYSLLIVLAIFMPYIVITVVFFSKNELSIFSKKIPLTIRTKLILGASLSLMFLFLILFGLHQQQNFEDEIVNLVNNKNYAKALDKVKKYEDKYGVTENKESENKIVVSKELLEDLQKINSKKINLSTLSVKESKQLLNNSLNKKFLVNKELNKVYLQKLKKALLVKVDEVNKIDMLNELYPIYKSNQNFNELKTDKYDTPYLNEVYNVRVESFLNSGGKEKLKNKYNQYLAEQKKLKQERLAEERRLERERKAEERRIKAQKKREGVRIGMSEQDVLDSSWGRPDDINRTTTIYGTREQWVYDRGGFNYNFLYFENGILTSIQN